MWIFIFVAAGVAATSTNTPLVLLHQPDYLLKIFVYYLYFRTEKYTKKLYFDRVDLIF